MTRQHATERDKPCPPAKPKEVAKPVFAEAVAQSSVAVGGSRDKETDLCKQFPV